MDKDEVNPMGAYAAVCAAEAAHMVQKYCGEKGRAGGKKHDAGKTRMELLTLGVPRALEGIAKVLTFGAQKYEAHSWREVEDGINRYIAANGRHWLEIGKHGLDARDNETGLLHIDHINCNGVFIAELIRSASGIEF